MRAAMGYDASHLTFFELIRDKSRLEGTAYFELHQGELPGEFSCWLDDSVFLRDAAFDFFVDCFHRANPRFDYFAFERFCRPEIEAVRVNLANFSSSLVPGCSRDAVFAMYSSLFSMDIWDSVDTELLRAAVVSSANEMIDFVGDAEKKDLVLWVIGM